jgi:hypothetical protein
MAHQNFAMKWPTTKSVINTMMTPMKGNNFVARLIRHPKNYVLVTVQNEATP